MLSRKKLSDSNRNALKSTYCIITADAIITHVLVADLHSCLFAFTVATLFEIIAQFCIVCRHAQKHELDRSTNTMRMGL
jgi:hypothetical protein